MTRCDPAFCADCGIDTCPDLRKKGAKTEWYMVHDWVWMAANPPRTEPCYLCIGCLEQRLGRRLTRKDFTCAAANTVLAKDNSDRLNDRLGMLRSAMIKVIVTNKSQNGVFDYTVPSASLDGRSREPLLDACRRLKRMGEAPAREACLFYGKSKEWALRTTVGYGAGLTVREDPSVRFVKFRAYPDVKRPD